MQNKIRCPWCGTDPLYMRYHDEEWGRPVHDDTILFEFLTLEWAQAGLSWITVLRKRENYRKHFHDWDILKIAEMTDEELENILQDSWIIRNRLKIYSVRKNAKVALEIQREFGSLDAYFWRITPLRKGDPAKREGDWGFWKSNPQSSLRSDSSFLKELQTFPIINHPHTLSEVRAETDISRAISKDLKKRGMSFVGSTIIYAFMQAVGMVDDHIESCFRKHS
jgi:DNA-3-methyladenine glycosylase I